MLPFSSTTPKTTPSPLPPFPYYSNHQKQKAITINTDSLKAKKKHADFICEQINELKAEVAKGEEPDSKKIDLRKISGPTCFCCYDKMHKPPTEKYFQKDPVKAEENRKEYLRKVAPPNRMVVLPCGHMYHRKCIFGKGLTECLVCEKDCVGFLYGDSSNNPTDSTESETQDINLYEPSNGEICRIMKEEFEYDFFNEEKNRIQRDLSPEARELIKNATGMGGDTGTEEFTSLEQHSTMQYVYRFVNYVRAGIKIERALRRKCVPKVPEKCHVKWECVDVVETRGSKEADVGGKETSKEEEGAQDEKEAKTAEDADEKETKTDEGTKKNAEKDAEKNGETDARKENEEKTLTEDEGSEEDPLAGNYQDTLAGIGKNCHSNVIIGGLLSVLDDTMGDLYCRDLINLAPRYLSEGSPPSKITAPSIGTMSTDISKLDVIDVLSYGGGTTSTTSTNSKDSFSGNTTSTNKKSLTSEKKKLISAPLSPIELQFFISQLGIAPLMARCAAERRHYQLLGYIVTHTEWKPYPFSELSGMKSELSGNNLLHLACMGGQRNFRSFEKYRDIDSDNFWQWVFFGVPGSNHYHSFNTNSCMMNTPQVHPNQFALPDLESISAEIISSDLSADNSDTGIEKSVNTSESDKIKPTFNTSDKTNATEEIKSALRFLQASFEKTKLVSNCFDEHPFNLQKTISFLIEDMRFSLETQSNRQKATPIHILSAQGLTRIRPNSIRYCLATRNCPENWANIQDGDGLTPVECVLGRHRTGCVFLYDTDSEITHGNHYIHGNDESVPIGSVPILAPDGGLNEETHMETLMIMLDDFTGIVPKVVISGEDSHPARETVSLALKNSSSMFLNSKSSKGNAKGRRTIDNGTNEKTDASADNNNSENNARDNARQEETTEENNIQENNTDDPAGTEEEGTEEDAGPTVTEEQGTEKDDDPTAEAFAEYKKKLAASHWDKKKTIVQTRLRQLLFRGCQIPGDRVSNPQEFRACTNHNDTPHTSIPHTSQQIPHTYNHIPHTSQGNVKVCYPAYYNILQFLLNSRSQSVNFLPREAEPNNGLFPMHLAAKVNCKDATLLRWLADKAGWGPAVSLVLTRTNRSAICYAASHGCLDNLKYLISQLLVLAKYDVDTLKSNELNRTLYLLMIMRDTIDGWSVCCHAGMAGAWQSIYILMDAVLNVKGCGKSEIDKARKMQAVPPSYAFFKAVFEGNSADSHLIEKLMKNLDAKKREQMCEVGILLGCARNNLGMVRAIFGNFKKIDIAEGKKGTLCATRHRRTTVDIEKRHTPLTLASLHGAKGLELVKFLIEEKKFPVFEFGEFGESPLWHAAVSNSPALCRYLYSVRDGNSPALCRYLYSVRDGNSPALCRYLYSVRDENISEENIIDISGVSQTQSKETSEKTQGAEFFDEGYDEKWAACSEIDDESFNISIEEAQFFAGWRKRTVGLASSELTSSGEKEKVDKKTRDYSSMQNAGFRSETKITPINASLFHAASLRNGSESSDNTSSNHAMLAFLCTCSEIVRKSSGETITELDGKQPTYQKDEAMAMLLSNSMESLSNDSNSRALSNSGAKKKIKPLSQSQKELLFCIVFDSGDRNSFPRDGNGLSPVHVAAAIGNFTAVKFFYEHPIARKFISMGDTQVKLDPNLPAPQGFTPLIYAAASGEKEVCSFLVKEIGASLLPAKLQFGSEYSNKRTGEFESPGSSLRVGRKLPKKDKQKPGKELKGMGMLALCAQRNPAQQNPEQTPEEKKVLSQQKEALSQQKKGQGICKTFQLSESESVQRGYAPVSAVSVAILNGHTELVKTIFIPELTKADMTKCDDTSDKKDDDPDKKDKDVKPVSKVYDYLRSIRLNERDPNLAFSFCNNCIDLDSRYGRKIPQGFLGVGNRFNYGQTAIEATIERIENGSGLTNRVLHRNPALNQKSEKKQNRKNRLRAARLNQLEKQQNHQSSQKNLESTKFYSQKNLESKTDPQLQLESKTALYSPFHLESKTALYSPFHLESKTALYSPFHLLCPNPANVAKVSYFWQYDDENVFLNDNLLFNLFDQTLSISNIIHYLNGFRKDFESFANNIDRETYEKDVTENYNHPNMDKSGAMGRCANFSDQLPYPGKLPGDFLDKITSRRGYGMMKEAVWETRKAIKKGIETDHKKDKGMDYPMITGILEVIKQAESGRDKIFLQQNSSASSILSGCKSDLSGKSDESKDEEEGTEGGTRVSPRNVSSRLPPHTLIDPARYRLCKFKEMLGFLLSLQSEEFASSGSSSSSSSALKTKLFKPETEYRIPERLGGWDLHLWMSVLHRQIAAEIFSHCKKPFIAIIKPQTNVIDRWSNDRDCLISFFAHMVRIGHVNFVKWLADEHFVFFAEKGAVKYLMFEALPGMNVLHLENDNRNDYDRNDCDGNDGHYDGNNGSMGVGLDGNDGINNMGADGEPGDLDLEDDDTALGQKDVRKGSPIPPNLGPNLGLVPNLIAGNESVTKSLTSVTKSLKMTTGATGIPSLQGMMGTMSGTMGTLPNLNHNGHNGRQQEQYYSVASTIPMCDSTYEGSPRDGSSPMSSMEDSVNSDSEKYHTSDSGISGKYGKCTDRNNDTSISNQCISNQSTRTGMTPRTSENFKRDKQDQKRESPAELMKAMMQDPNAAFILDGTAFSGMSQVNAMVGGMSQVNAMVGGMSQVNAMVGAGISQVGVGISQLGIAISQVEAITQVDNATSEINIAISQPDAIPSDVAVLAEDATIPGEGAAIPGHPGTNPGDPGKNLVAAISGRGGLGAISETAILIADNADNASSPNALSPPMIDNAPADNSGEQTPEESPNTPPRAGTPAPPPNTRPHNLIIHTEGLLGNLGTQQAADGQFLDPNFQIHADFTSLTGPTGPIPGLNSPLYSPNSKSSGVLLCQNSLGVAVPTTKSKAGMSIASVAAGMSIASVATEIQFSDGNEIQVGKNKSANGSEKTYTVVKSSVSQHLGGGLDEDMTLEDMTTTRAPSSEKPSSEKKKEKYLKVPTNQAAENLRNKRLEFVLAARQKGGLVHKKLPSSKFRPPVVLTNDDPQIDAHIFVRDSDNGYTDDESDCEYSDGSGSDGSGGEGSAEDGSSSNSEVENEEEGSTHGGEDADAAGENADTKIAHHKTTKTKKIDKSTFYTYLNTDTNLPPGLEYNLIAGYCNNIGEVPAAKFLPNNLGSRFFLEIWEEQLSERKSMIKAIAKKYNIPWPNLLSRRIDRVKLKDMIQMAIQLNLKHLLCLLINDCQGLRKNSEDHNQDAFEDETNIKNRHLKFLTPMHLLPISEYSRKEDWEYCVQNIKQLKRANQRDRSCFYSEWTVSEVGSCETMLHESIIRGDANMLKLLLETAKLNLVAVWDLVTNPTRGGTLVTKNSNFDSLSLTPFLLAAKNGSVAQMKFLLKILDSCLQSAKKKETDFLEVKIVDESKLKKFEDTLEKGEQNIGLANDSKKAAAKNKKTVKDNSSKNKDMDTTVNALMLGSNVQDVSNLVKKLIAKKPEDWTLAEVALEQSQINRVSPLQMACAHGNLEAIHYLVGVRGVGIDGSNSFSGKSSSVTESSGVKSSSKDKELSKEKVEDDATKDDADSKEKAGDDVTADDVTKDEVTKDEDTKDEATKENDEVTKNEATKDTDDEKDIDTIPQKTTLPPFLEAVRHGHLACAQYLVMKGAHVNIRCKQKNALDLVLDQSAEFQTANRNLILYLLSLGLQPSIAELKVSPELKLSVELKPSIAELKPHADQKAKESSVETAESNQNDDATSQNPISSTIFNAVQKVLEGGWSPDSHSTKGDSASSEPHTHNMSQKVFQSASGSGLSQRGASHGDRDVSTQNTQTHNTERHPQGDKNISNSSNFNASTPLRTVVFDARHGFGFWGESPGLEEIPEDDDDDDDSSSDGADDVLGMPGAGMPGVGMPGAGMSGEDGELMDIGNDLGPSDSAPKLGDGTASQSVPKFGNDGAGNDGTGDDGAENPFGDTDGASPVTGPVADVSQSVANVSTLNKGESFLTGDNVVGNDEGGNDEGKTVTEGEGQSGSGDVDSTGENANSGVQNKTTANRVSELLNGGSRVGSKGSRKGEAKKRKRCCCVSFLICDDIGGNTRVGDNIGDNIGGNDEEKSVNAEGEGQSGSGDVDPNGNPVDKGQVESSGVENNATANRISALLNGGSRAGSGKSKGSRKGEAKKRKRCGCF